MSDGAEGLHYILELPADSPAFRHDVEAALGFARNPLYAVLQEACWADGGATRWAAQRLLPSAYEAEPELFFGEHVYPWMFEDYGALAPLREAARHPRRARVAAALRPRPPGRQRGAGGRRDLRRGHVRRARVLRGDRGAASAACGPGSPTSTSTTACAPTARASSATSSTSRAGGREDGRDATGPARTSSRAAHAAPAHDPRAAARDRRAGAARAACWARATRSATSPTPPSW